MAPRSARADDSENFFAQGRTLRSQGKCAEAILAFRRAFDLKPDGLGSLRNVSECEEELGQFASARADWWNLRRAALQSNEPKYAGWDKDAEAAYKRLEAKVARITIKLTGYQPERARLSIDGKPLDPRLIGVELERDLGAYTIEVQYGAATPLKEHHEATAGAREVITIDIPVPKPNDVIQPKPGDGGEPQPGGNKALRNGGIAAIAIGGASLIGMGVAIGLRQSALSDFSVCAPSYTSCPRSLMGDQSTGQTASTLATVFAVVGAAGVAAGIPMIIVGTRGGDTKSDAAPKAALRVIPTAGGAGVQAGWRF
jgi:hypothetical protein